VVQIAEALYKGRLGFNVAENYASRQEKEIGGPHWAENLEIINTVRTLRNERLALSSIYLTPTAGPVATEYGNVGAARVWAWFIRHHRHALYAALRAAREKKMNTRM
jgi:hypothetical protein